MSFLHPSLATFYMKLFTTSFSARHADALLATHLMWWKMRIRLNETGLEIHREALAEITAHLIALQPQN